MKKINDKKINIKLVNIILIILIICLLYSIRGLWVGIIDVIWSIIFPFLLAFLIAYALYPITKRITESGVSKWIAVLIVSIITFGFLGLLFIIVIPLLYDQIILFLSNITIFVSGISSKFNIDLGVLESSLSNMTSDIISNVGHYISDGAINIINTSISMITTFIITAFVSVYLLYDMEEMRTKLKKALIKRKNRSYQYIKKIDREVSNYFIGLGKNILIQFVEYTTLFFLIGHPNFLILGILTALSAIIPYFGGMIMTIVALLIASVVSTKVFILTLLICIICPQIDSYVIAPKVYGKTNNLHPLVNIFAIFAGGVIAGFWGIVVALPVAIIIITSYKFFQSDINSKISEMKEIKERSEK